MAGEGAAAIGDEQRIAAHIRKVCNHLIVAGPTPSASKSTNQLPGSIEDSNSGHGGITDGDRPVPKPHDADDSPELIRAIGVRVLADADRGFGAQAERARDA